MRRRREPRERPQPADRYPPPVAVRLAQHLDGRRREEGRVGGKALPLTVPADRRARRAERAYVLRAKPRHVRLVRDEVIAPAGAVELLVDVVRSAAERGVLPADEVLACGRRGEHARAAQLQRVELEHLERGERAVLGAEGGEEALEPHIRCPVGFAAKG